VRVAVSGSSGLIGTALCRALVGRGDEVVRLVRRPPGPGEAAWDPAAGRVDEGALAGADAVVNLAGAGIGDRRWTPGRRRELVASRVDATSVLARALAAAGERPRVLVNASAVGVYGDRGDELLDETSAPGSGFLADLCGRWEQATAPAAEAGVRVLCMRSGIVLSAAGGALGRQLPLFRLGLGARLGSGRQWVSWISIQDEVGALLHVLDHDDLHGPVNAVAPGAVTNRQLTAALGRVLRRPAVLAVPAPLLRAALGRELADEALLASQRVRPAVLERSGYRFAHPDLDGALEALLAPSRP
jgi:uncharacterized protein (TIGR01777 family)